MGVLSDFRYRRISQTATVNDLLKEVFRKSIHICSSAVPFLAAWNFRFTIVSLSAVMCAYIWCEYRRLSGHYVPFVSKITAFAARRRDTGLFVLGPVTMAFGVLFTLLLFPPEAAMTGIFALAFGDGIASLAGKAFGKTKLPFTNGKSLEGSLACFCAVYASTLIVRGEPLSALFVALAAMLIEVLPIKDYDNLLIPVCISALAWLLP